MNLKDNQILLEKFIKCLPDIESYCIVFKTKHGNYAVSFPKGRIPKLLMTKGIELLAAQLSEEVGGE